MDQVLDTILTVLRIMEPHIANSLHSLAIEGKSTITLSLKYNKPFYDDNHVSS